MINLRQTREIVVLSAVSARDFALYQLACRKVNFGKSQRKKKSCDNMMSKRHEIYMKAMKVRSELNLKRRWKV